MTLVLFVVLPYAALLLAIAGGLYRYFRDRFAYSSLSSQLIENRSLWWGSIPWHYGIVPILLAHLLAGLLPGPAGAVLRNPIALLVLELVGMSLGLFTVFGVITLIVRRARRSALWVVTSRLDWILLVLLALQVVLGVCVAMFARWGSRWYLHTAVPWFWSLVTLRPDPAAVLPLPFWVLLHFINGFVLILLFPFTRLAHAVSVPLSYLWRPYQVVIWNRTPRRAAAAAVGGGPPMHAQGADAPGGDPPATDPPGDDPPGDPPSAQVVGPGPLARRAAPGGSVPGAPRDARRRRFLNRLSLIFAGAGALLVGVPSGVFLLGLRRSPSVWRSVGKVEDFAAGTTTKVSFLDPSPLPWAGITAQTAAWLRRDAGDRFVAFAVNCTHLGCPIRWLQSADLFMCPCHGGVFYKDGTVAAGPPPRSLTRYPVRVRDGQVEVLTSPLPIT